MTSPLATAPTPASQSVRGTRRPRVLQCITRLGLGGSERVAFDLMRELRATHDFALFTAYQGVADAPGAALERELNRAGTRWFSGTSIAMKHGGPLLGGLALARAIRAFSPDVIHFHAEVTEACGAALSLLPFVRRRPALVRTIHNCVFWRYWPRVGRWCDHRLAAAHVACVSAAAREEFIRYRQDSGVADSAPEPAIVYNGVARPRLAPRTEPLRPGVRRVLFAGRYEEQKGVDILLAALPHVQAPRSTELELGFAGDGTQRALVDAASQRPPNGWTIANHGPVADVQELFSRFDVLVVPSRFEGLGLVAIEATLAGLPVVVTDAPGLRETLPLDHPWRATPGDAKSLAHALTSALTETPRWAAATFAAQTLAESRFDSAAMGVAYQKLYARALADQPARRAGRA